MDSNEINFLFFIVNVKFVGDCVVIKLSIIIYGSLNTCHAGHVRKGLQNTCLEVISTKVPGILTKRS